MYKPSSERAAHSHHHTSTDSVERVGSDTSDGSDDPSESEGSEEVVLEGTSEDDRLCAGRISALAKKRRTKSRETDLDGVVETKVQTTLHKVLASNSEKAENART